MNTIDPVEQCLEWGLRTNLSGESPPDLRSCIQAAVRGGGAPRPQPATRLRHGNLLLGAAGVAVAIGVAWLAREDATPARLAQEPATRVQAPATWIVVANANELAALPVDCTTLRLGHWSDAAAGGDTSGLAAVLARTPKLERLDLGHFVKDAPLLTAADLAALGRHLPLRELRLAGRREVTAEWLAPLAALPALATLQVPHTSLGDAGAAAIARLPVLATLEVAFDPSLGEPGIKSLATVPGLRELSLRGCTGLTASALVHVAALHQLERLDLDVCNGAALPPDRGLPPHLFAMSESMLVTELMAQGGRGGGVDDTVLAALKGSAKLRELRLLGCRAVTRAGLEHLAKVPLRRLAVSLPDEDAVAFVEALPPTLEALSVAWSRRADDAVMRAVAARLPLLREIDLMQCRAITDVGLTALFAAVPLRRVDLRGCSGLTAKALPVLLAQPQLEALDVSGASWVDEAAVAALKALPAMSELKHRRGSTMMPGR